ncbi:MAG TPA: dienelactone hydrolase family protein [Ferruginibacter sp.]|nr:dienelactone hydrolase family protein [Ferruginibacter sp.]HMP19975.1 dienelactone hydrolase family protein [Ferruginibacter sp.]
MKQAISALFIFSLSLTTCMVMAQQKTAVKGEAVTYQSADGTTCKGYVAYDAAIKGKRPAIVVIHEWWGNNNYTRKRADMLAELGYIAIAMDMYGDGEQGPTPKEASALAGKYYSNPQLAKQRIEAAIKTLKNYPETDETQMACIGYCFGGSMSLFAARLGLPFKGVVSFHGGFAGIPGIGGATSSKILVCHGGADKFVSDEEIKLFRENLDSLKTDYSFIIYPGAVHAFSNPDATMNGKKFGIPIEYNEAADKKSWEDMKQFFTTVFK